MNYYFNVVIGDYRAEGHERTETYLVKSNRPVAAVRDAHFDIKPRTGVDVENMCSMYGEDQIDDATLEKLNSLGFAFKNNPAAPGITYPDEMARIWVFLLEKACPGLRLEILNPETLNFMGPDAKHREMQSVGYGLFS